MDFRPVHVQLGPAPNTQIPDEATKAKVITQLGGKLPLLDSSPSQLEARLDQAAVLRRVEFEAAPQAIKKGRVNATRSAPQSGARVTQRLSAFARQEEARSLPGVGRLHDFGLPVLLRA